MIERWLPVAGYETLYAVSDLGRAQFADMLEKEVLAGLTKRTEEIRQALRLQADSENCVRGLIAFAREPVAA